MINDERQCGQNLDGEEGRPDGRPWEVVAADRRVHPWHRVRGRVTEETVAAVVDGGRVPKIPGRDDREPGAEERRERDHHGEAHRNEDDELSRRGRLPRMGTSRSRWLPKGVCDPDRLPNRGLSDASE